MVGEDTGVTCNSVSEGQEEHPVGDNVFTKILGINQSLVKGEGSTTIQGDGRPADIFREMMDLQIEQLVCKKLRGNRGHTIHSEIRKIKML